MKIGLNKGRRVTNLQLTNDSYLYPNYKRSELNFSHGQGSYLYTKDGEEFLDFTAGIAVNALGHAHPYLIEKLHEQTKKLWHVSNLFTIEPQELLAKKLCELSFAKRVFFASSGTEAVECAIKTARHYYYSQGKDKKSTIISFTGAFHGRTLGSLAATGRKKYLEGFAPICAGFYQINLNNSQNDIEKELKKLVSTSAAIIIEPIQGESGVNVISNEFLQFLRAFCTKHDLLLIFDEIQTGIGRTGTLFAYEQTNIEPDIMTLAKALGGGFPISACLCDKDIGEDMTPGTHGATFGGNYLATTISSAVLDIVAQPQFLQNVKKLSIFLKNELTNLANKYPHLIIKIQGKGLLLGIKTKIPTEHLIEACKQHKLLTLGADNNIMRFMPALNITKHEANLALSKLEAALNSLK